MKIRFSFIALSMIICSGLYAQDDERVDIGSKAPDIKFRVVNHTKSELQLSDFEGKVVILDFWDTHCSPCLKKLPLLDSLQSVYKEDLQILLVNSSKREPELIVRNFFKETINKKTGKLFDLISAVEDTVAIKIFPVHAMPQCVWIDRKGVVRALTSGEFLNVESVQKMIARK